MNKESPKRTRTYYHVGFLHGDQQNPKKGWTKIVTTRKPEANLWIWRTCRATSKEEAEALFCLEELDCLRPLVPGMRAERFVQGIPVNPELPKHFSSTDNEKRPASHLPWVHVPYIETTSVEQLDADYAGRTDDYAEEARASWNDDGRKSWMEAWPTGTRYDVRCLDGGAWDRPTCWGMFRSIEQAIECVNEGPAWRRTKGEAAQK